MAASDRFYLRGRIDCPNDNTFAQTTIDLGAYVDALGKSILKVHKLEIQYSDSNGATPDLTGSANGSAAAAQFQLTTQSQSGLLSLDDRAVVSNGYMSAWTNEVAGNVVPFASSQAINVGPESWEDGYLIAVDSMFFGGSASANWAENVHISFVIECSVTSLTQAKAVALALSQQ